MHPRVIAPLDRPAPCSGQSRTIYSEDEPGARLALAEIVARRGDEPPLHRHHHEDLLIYVVAGELTFHIEGRHVPATRGSLVVLPRGTEHGYTIQSEQAHLLVIVTPAGAEGFLTALHDPDCRAGSGAGEEAAETLERLITNAARHGIDITGPPPALP